MGLIDADELKEIIHEEVTEKFVRWDKTITVAEWETFIRDIIDNAPTVEITEEQAIDKLHETGWLPEHDKEMTERPQGKWIDIGNTKACNFCSVCKEFILSTHYNFCPNCGAQMKTRTDAD